MRAAALALLALAACTPAGGGENAGEPAMNTPVPSPAGGQDAAKTVDQPRR